MAVPKYDLKEAAQVFGFVDFTMAPLLHRVIVEIPPEREKVGSIIVPDSMRDRDHLSEHVGVVHQIGDIAFKNFGSNIKPEVGDWVFFKAHAGEIFHKGEFMYRLMNDEDVLAIMEVNK